MLLGTNIYHRTYRIAIACGEGKQWGERRGWNECEGRANLHTQAARIVGIVTVLKYTAWCTSVCVYSNLEVHGVCVRSPELNDTSLYTKKASALHVDVYVPEPPSQDNIAVASQHTREFKAGHLR